jgi:3-hydroxyisobutyrate dehydrogenase-like beta-hydroxyacid dehydrogenase
MRIIMAEGENLGIPLPFSSQVYDLFKEMILKGRSEYDHTGLLTLMEERACIQD